MDGPSTDIDSDSSDWGEYPTDFDSAQDANTLESVLPDVT